MRKILFIVLALCLSQPLHAATAATGVVQSVAAQAASIAPSITTSGITTTSGNLFVVLVTSFTNNIGSTPVTDSKSNTWVQGIASFGTTSSFAALYYCTSNCVGGASHTFTFTPTATVTCAIFVFEIAGQTASPLGSSNTASNNTTTHTSGNITSNASSPAIFIGFLSVCCSTEGTAKMTAPTPWFVGSSLPGGAPEGGLSAFRLVPPSTTDAFAPAALGSSQNEAILIQEFKLTAATTGVTGFFIPHD